MANEARITVSLVVSGPNGQQFTSQPQSFTADISKAGGPAPGGFLASRSGTRVDLSNLTQAKWAWVYNIGVDVNGNSLEGTAGQEYTWTNWTEWGVVDHLTGNFYPVFELLPGEGIVFPISRYINQEIGTGSGTAPGPDSVSFTVRSVGVASKVLVMAFER